MKSNKGNNFRHLLCICLFLLSAHAFGQNQPNGSSYETFNVTINFDKIGHKGFNALYKEPSNFYLPIDDLFDYLKIYRNVSSDGQTIKGYLLLEKNTFEIAYAQMQINYLEKKYPIASGEMILDMGTLYIKKEALERVFGFKIKFDFRSLSADFIADFELPLARFMRLEKARENVKKRQDIIEYDSIMPRNYHWYKPGMLDWSIASNQSKDYMGETRLGIAAGAEILGGETNVWLNYSDKYGFNKNQQQYYWRWVNNNSVFAKQVQIGRIYNSTIATLLAPVDGFIVTNAPSTVRKALGNYMLSDHTEPDWIVELYINNVLMNFTRADASGFYSFKVPIVYGTSKITLRFYGPNGEVRSEEKTYNMPYNLLPIGEFEYRISGGTLLDSIKSKYGRAEANIGLTNWLTVGGGAEYLSTIVNNPGIPFMNFTFQPVAKLIFTGEYAYKVRTKAHLNYSFVNSSVMELNYAKYNQEQKAVIYNYLEEKDISLSTPIRFKRISGFAKTTIREFNYPNFNFYSGEVIFSGYYLNYNINLSNYFNWTDMGSKNVYSNLALGAKLGKGLTIRPSVQFNYTTQTLISLKVEAEKQVFGKGYLSLGYENNLLVNYSSINLSFRYDFSFMSSYLSTYFSNKQIQTSESAKGSFAFGSGNGYVHKDSHEAVGRSGISIEPFIDLNFNGVRDPGEPLAPKLAVKCTGGKVIYLKNDSIVRIIGLDPFVDYSITLSEVNFDNIAWRIAKHTLKVTSDPNQFKRISVAVQAMTEITSMILDKDGKGKGRILVNILDENDKVVAKVITESDGYFSYMGLRPGKYRVEVDKKQLEYLKEYSEPLTVIIGRDFTGDTRDIGTITLADEKPLLKKLPEITNEKDIITDSLNQYMVLFDHNRAEVHPKYMNSLIRLANKLKKYDCIKLEIQGHADSDGSLEYNQILSEKRAKSIMDELIKLGVHPDRLSFKGFGSVITKAGYNNNNQIEKAKNRRVIFKNLSGIDCGDVSKILNAKELMGKKRIKH